MTKRSSTKISIFDKVIIGHSFVDGLTGLIDMPLFHLASLFGYFPLGSILANMWSSYDNNINMTTSLHMFYMSYVRIRSLEAPKSYLDEFLIRHPVYIMISFWVMGLTTWIPVVYVYGVKEYSLDINYGDENYALKISLNIITWLIPLLLILIISIKIVYFLNMRKRNAIVMRAPKKSTIYSGNATTTTISRETWNRRLFKACFNYRFSAQTKFMIIISTYWLQWILPCLLTIINPICGECIPQDIYLAIYWTTFTVCLIDPLIVLILNPNVSCMRV